MLCVLIAETLVFQSTVRAKSDFHIFDRVSLTVGRSIKSISLKWSGYVKYRKSVLYILVSFA